MDLSEELLIDYSPRAAGLTCSSVHTGDIDPFRPPHRTSSLAFKGSGALDSLGERGSQRFPVTATPYISATSWLWPLLLALCAVTAHAARTPPAVPSHHISLNKVPAPLYLPTRLFLEPVAQLKPGSPLGVNFLKVQGQSTGQVTR